MARLFYRARGRRLHPCRVDSDIQLPALLSRVNLLRSNGHHNPRGIMVVRFLALSCRELLAENAICIPLVPDCLGFIHHGWWDVSDIPLNIDVDY